MKFRSALATLSAVLLVAYSASSTFAEKQAATEAGHAPFGSVAALAVSCSGCHGEGGQAIVSLADLSADDIEARFLMYRRTTAVSYTHLRAHETEADLVCRLLLEKKK